jgi:hypothetical protein
MRAFLLPLGKHGMVRKVSRGPFHEAVKRIVATPSDRSRGFGRSRHRRQKQRTIPGANIASNGGLDFLFFRYILLAMLIFRLAAIFSPDSRNSGALGAGAPRGAPCKPLKTFKTAKECLGQALRSAGNDLKRL